MTTSQDLLQAVYEAIAAAGTGAGDRVYTPGDWPTQPDQYPIVKLRLVSEQRRSSGRSGPPQFETVAVVRILAEASSPADFDNAGASDAEQKLWSLKRQIEVAVINSYPLEQQIEQIATVNSQLAFTSEAATHLAGLQMDLSLEFYEGPESFAPVEADDLEEADVTGIGPGLTIPTT